MEKVPSSLYNVTEGSELLPQTIHLTVVRSRRKGTNSSAALVVAWDEICIIAVTREGEKASPWHRQKAKVEQNK